MKRKTAQATVAVLFAVGMVVGVARPVHADDQSCSLTRAAGTYGVSDSGTVISIGPRAAVALLTLNAKGNINGKVTASLNGTVSNTTLSGTYDVNPDCTGTTTFGEYDTSGKLLLNATVALVWDADMQEFRFLFTSAALADGTSLATVINGDARKEFTPKAKGNLNGASSTTDNAPGSPQAASLSGTGTEVELNPSSLSFFCQEIPCYGSQTITLTNAGATALSIASISITASKPLTFSQSNNCGESVGAGGSCSITVVFAPRLAGPVTGDVVVTDNGGGSPQQVSLLGEVPCCK